MIAEEGTRALWKGLTPFAMHLTLKYALRMGSNSVYQGLLRDEQGQLSSGRRLAAGFMAGGGQWGQQVGGSGGSRGWGARSR